MGTRKLLAFDLDQTIVTNDQELPVSIREAIIRARQAGHFVAVLTGRPLAAAQPVLEQLGLDSHYSVNHGAMVVGASGTIIKQLRMPWADVTSILHPELETTLEYSCVIDDTLYVRKPDDARWSWAHTRNRRVEAFHFELGLDADKVVFSADSDPYMGENEQILRHAEELERDILQRFPHLVTYLWNNGYLEVTGADSDKGSALKLLAQQLGVDRQDTVAFGDGLNDLSMLSWAGHSVAVGPHAHKRVLAVAREHIAPPEQDGVRLWLETNLGI